MKRILSIAVLLFLIHISYAQSGTFTISINKKNIINSKILPSATAQKASISKSLIKVSNTIVIDIKENDPQKDWHRVFIFINEKEEEVGRYSQKSTSGKFTIISKDLKKESGAVLKIMTMNEPDDPNAAATMRLRTLPLVDITVK